MSVVIWVSAVVVECPGRKPCWCAASGRCWFISGRRHFSKIFIAGDSSDMGLYDFASLSAFPGFNSGIIWAVL